MEILAFLRQNSAFGLLPGDSLRQLALSCRRRSYKAKQIIFLEGDDADYAYAVLDGHVALSKTSPSGKEFVVELLPQGELFAVIALLEKRPYPLTARAQSASEVLEIPKTTVTEIAKEHPELHQGLLAIVSGRLRSSHNVARSLAHERVEVRIAAALIALVPQFASGNSVSDANLRITRQELADLTGTTIETATRVTKAMERDGLIAITRGRLGILDLQRLRQLVDEDSTSS